MSQSKEENSNKQPQKIIMVIIMAAAGYFGYQYFLGGNHDSVSEESLTPRKVRIPEEDQEISYPKSSRYSSTGALKEEEKDSNEEKKPDNGDVSQKSDVKADIEIKIEERKREQEELTRKFQNTLQAKIYLPKNLYYHELDLDEGVAGIRGTGTGDIKDFTVLATAKRVNDQQIAGFLNEQDSGVPASKGVRFKTKPTMKVKAPPGKGVAEIKVFESNNPNVKAAYMKRRDGKGSYLFIIKGQSGFFDKNEGFLDNMMNSFQAQ